MRAIAITVFLTILLFQKISGQFDVTLLADTSGYKYFYGPEVSDSSWNTLSYNDSLWHSASGNIGYGQNDVKTVIEKTTSVYLRFKFTITNKEQIKALCLYADFNDGFIAYINGKLVALENLDTAQGPVQHSHLATRSHKAHAYRNYYDPIEGYYIDDKVIIDCLQEGDNVLSVQVHNDSIAGNDLFFNCSLYDYTGHIFNCFDRKRYLRQVSIDSTLFPIIVINTDGYGMPVDTAKYEATMGIIDNSNGQYNKPGQPFNGYNGKISIKVRGSSSRYFYPKKNFSVETQDDNGNNNNVSLLGMPKENDWVLVSLFNDISLIRNELAFNIGRKQGHYQPRTRYCEVILNGTNLGLYALTEKIKRDANRVNISKHPEYEVDGSFLIKLDGGLKEFEYVYPQASVLSPEQSDFISNFYYEFKKAANGNTFNDPDLGYRKYINDSSLIDYIIVQECMKNVDGYFKSTYVYRDNPETDGRLNFGPLWDHDVAFRESFEEWHFDVDYDRLLPVKKILRDTIFLHKLQHRWFELRKSFMHTDSIFYTIDSLANYIKEPRVRNFQIWPILGGEMFMYWRLRFETYDSAITYLKTWIDKRFKWMDENIVKIYYPVNSIAYNQAAANINVYPNPFSEKLHISLSENVTANEIEIINLWGQTVLRHKIDKHFKEVKLNNVSDLSTGVYFISIFQNSKKVFTQMVVKQ